MEGGTYTITITGLPADASFDATTAEVTIAQSGQSVTRNFAGAWVRTASLMGMVTVEGEGLPGITVSITGRQDDQMVTDDNGQYTFTGLRAGNYTVEITGFDATGVAFSATSSAIEVSAGESKVWSFDGTYVRESAIAGQVSVEGNGLSDVTVSLQGMGADDTEMTDAGGQFTFPNLRAGEYQLAISGFDAREYGFSTTSATVRLEHGRTANVPFEGIMLRTASIMGQVSVEGEGLEDVTVSLSGEGENQTAMTDESGQYTFSELPAGNFQVGISGYDTDDYSFETTSKNIHVPLGETATVPFEGILLRTSGIAGRVSVGGAGIGDVTVTLSGAEDRTATTDATGQYAISGLAAGDYTVTISGYDALEYSFEDSQDVTLAMDDTEIVNFAGKSLRTAAVAVMVTADGDGVAGVTATLYKITNLVTQQGSIVGARATGADGGQTFSNLLAGAYLVQITGADAEIDFAGGTSMVVNAMTDMTAEANFPGMINRTASISGTVMVDGAGKPGVMVMLSGDEGDMTRETDADGAYSFTGLRRGDYTVSITNPNEAMYSFTRTSQEVDLGLAQAPGDVSFAGSLIKQSSINGQVSVGGSGLKDVTVTLSGAADDTDTTGESGLYSFTGLATGSYTVTISAYDAEEYSFASESEDIELGNSDEKTENFSGTSLRTASVTVTVTAEGTGVASAVATLTKTTGKSEPDRTGATDADGMYTFGDLLAGTYQVDISGTDEEIDFGDDGTSWTGPVATDGTAEAAFPGTYNRTASIGGTVTIDGAGMPDVVVMLSGDEGDDTYETDTDGAYIFPGLRRGEYTVSITNPDEAMYDFRGRTSKKVDLALGQAPGDISFAGSMVQQSHIRGQVTVERAALPGVTVTLGGAGDDTRTTGDDGLYAFLNLGSGTYTVSMANPDDAAYIFDTEPVEIELGNTDDQSYDFDGDHTREANISGMLFVDEGTKNYLHDEGEEALAAKDVKVMLVGPTSYLNRDSTKTDETGMFTFPELRQGTYQLMLKSPDAAVMDDFGYGGDASYTIEVGVGADGGATQNLPFEITHQTVNFTVNLKSGDAPLGDALPGAMITLFSDAAGTKLLESKATDENGEASIRFEREGTTGNTVHAAIAAPSGDYHAAGGMQAVTWDSQHRMTDAANAGDIVNTKADFSFSGATVARPDWGEDGSGGMPLGDWAIEVTTIDADGDMEAVADAPTVLGADGSESFSEVVDAADLPRTYHVVLASWEDQSDDDETGDGGERYTSTTLEHIHNGLSLAGTETDAGTLVATYTRQTLKVYVYQENDQVTGYTGNVLGGDERMTGRLDVDLRYLDGSGRSRPHVPTDTIGIDEDGGVWTFSNVPAHWKVVVTADETSTLGEDADGNDIFNNAELLKVNGHNDEVAGYTDMDANGIMGGAFGANGGFNHTVELCPLMSREGNQRYGECGTFAFVNTYAVDGQAWKNVVKESGEDFKLDADGDVIISTSGHVGVTVSMDFVEGENLAEDQDVFEAKTAGSKTFDFDHMASGVYTVTVPDGWQMQRGPADDPTDDLEDHIAPLASDLNIDVTPTTGYVYGTVEDGANRRLEGVTVTVNGETGFSDSNGLYTVDGFDAQKGCGTSTTKNQICVTTAEDESEPTADAATFAANTPKRVDITITDETEIATISGTVTMEGVGVEDVQIKLTGATIRNLNARSSSKAKKDDIYKTPKTGIYYVEVLADGEDVTVTPELEDHYFSPEEIVVKATGTPSGINFVAFENGSILGRVVDGDDEPISGVIVTATQAGDGDTDADTTGTTGTYTLSVRPGSYTVEADKAGYSFTEVKAVNVPNDGKAIEDIIGTGEEDNADLSSLTLSGVTLKRATGTTPRGESVFKSDVKDYIATVRNSVTSTTVRATAAVSGAKVVIYPGAQVDLEVGDNDIEVTVTSADGDTEKEYTVEVYRQAPSNVISGTITDAVSGDGISGVRVTVSDGLVGGSTDSRTKARYVTTDPDGEYTANVESAETGSTTLTPTKDDYTFDPEVRTVQRDAGSVTGIDFTGSTYGTITGTVTDVDGNGLPGVKVTAGSEKPVTTNRRGSYSVDVPAGNVLVTAELGGYDFDPVSVNVIAGETRTLDFDARGTIQPTNVEGERDVNAGAFDGNVTVTWMAGGRDLDGVAYAVEACVPSDTEMCAADGSTWTSFGTWESDPTNDDYAGLSVTAGVSGLTDSDNGFMVRVTATHTDPDDISLASEPDDVDAINVQPSNVTVERDIGVGRFNLTVNWDGDRAGTTTARIIGSFDDGDTWVVLGDNVDFSSTDDYTAGGEGDPDHEYTLALAASEENVVDPDDGIAVEDDRTTPDVDESMLDVTNMMLEGKFMIRVQMRHEGVDEDDEDDSANPWKSSASETVNES